MTDRLEEALSLVGARPEYATALATIDAAVSLRTLAGREIPDLGAVTLDHGPNVVSAELPPVTASIPVQAAEKPTRAPRRRGAGAVPALSDEAPAPEAVVVPEGDAPKTEVDALTAEFGDEFDDYNLDKKDTAPAVPLKNPAAKKPKSKVTEEPAPEGPVGISEPDDADVLEELVAEAAKKSGKKGKKGKGKKGKKA